MFNLLFDYLPGGVYLCKEAIKKYREYQAATNKAYLEQRLKHVNFKKLSNEIVSISREQLGQLWEQYKASDYFRHILHQWNIQVSSEESLSVKNADAADDDKTRAEILVGYMTNKSNWKLGFCRFLFDSYLDNKLLAFLSSEVQQSPKKSSTLIPS